MSLPPFNTSSTEPLQYLGQPKANPPNVFERDRPPTPNDDGNLYSIGDLWIDTVTDLAYILTDRTPTMAVWVLAGAASALNTLTGDVGGAVTAVAGNINVQGGAAGAISFSNGGAGQMDAQVLVDGVTITIVGNQLVASASAITFPVDNGGPGVPAPNFSLLGSTSTDFTNASGIETHVGATTDEMYIENRRFLSAFVVDPSATVGLRGEYTTPLAAATAASAAGGGVVYIRPGNYGGAFTLPAGVDLVGVSGFSTSQKVNLQGTLTVAAAGFNSISNIRFDTGASTGIDVTLVTELTIENCVIETTTGAAIDQTAGDVFVLDSDVSSSAGNAILSVAPGVSVSNSQVTGTVRSGTTGDVTLTNSFLNGQFTLTGTAEISFIRSNMDSGASQAVSAGAGTTFTALHSTIICNFAGDFIAGAGTFNYTSIILVGTSTTLDPALTINNPDWKPYGDTAGVVGVNAYDPADFSVDATTGVVSALGSSPLTGTATTVGAVTADIITIPGGAVAGMYQVECELSAFESTTPAGAWYSLSGGARTDGVTATEVGSEDRENGEDAALTAANATIVVSGNDIIVRVLGVAGLTVNWSAEAYAIFVS